MTGTISTELLIVHFDEVARLMAEPYMRFDYLFFLILTETRKIPRTYSEIV